jgi:hypothetical protein
LQPPTERGTHLALVWETGTPADPVQRWVIYEAVPQQYLADGTIEALKEFAPCRCPKNPDLMGTCRRCGRVQSPGRHRILDYYLRTGCLLKPFWVVQGSGGGHAYRYTAQERSWARFLGRPEAPPAPGDLPYAPVDQRVIRQLRARDRAHRAEATLALAADQAERDAEVDLRKAMLASFAGEMRDAVHDTWTGIADAIPVRHGDSRWDTVDDDAVDERYVSTGELTLT